MLLLHLFFVFGVEVLVEFSKTWKEKSMAKRRKGEEGPLTSIIRSFDFNSYNIT